MKNAHARRCGPRSSRPSRRGTAIVMAIVCLSVVALLSVGLLKLAVESRQLQAASATRLQADWLAESALDRALARLARDANYAGESWKLSAVELALTGRSPDQAMAVVEIVVEPVAGQPEHRRVRTQVTYPLGDPQAVQSSRQIGPFRIPRRSSRS